MTATVLIHRVDIGYMHPQIGRGIFALCSKKPERDMDWRRETVTAADKVNCPDCISRLAWIDQDYATGDLVLHWPPKAEGPAQAEAPGAA